jgi:hypothetical protein
MDENELKLQMRLYAVEILAANLLAMSCLQSSLDPSNLIARLRQQIVEGARGHTFPGLEDPAMSDLYSAELEAAVDRLMEMATAQTNVVLQARQKRPGSRA